MQWVEMCACYWKYIFLYLTLRILYPVLIIWGLASICSAVDCWLRAYKNARLVCIFDNIAIHRHAVGCGQYNMLCHFSYSAACETMARNKKCTRQLVVMQSTRDFLIVRCFLVIHDTAGIGKKKSIRQQGPTSSNDARYKCHDVQW